MPVEVAQVASSELVKTIRVVGNIQAVDEATLYSKVTGKLIRYEVKEGDAVKKDDPVAWIDRNQVGFKYQESPVLSTLSGTVGKTYLDRGADVQLTTPVALVVNLDEVRFVAEIGERHLPKIELGQSVFVKVDAYPNREFYGTIVEESRVIDRRTRTFEVEIAILNGNHRLLPGMFAKGEIIIERVVDALFVPESAIVTKGGDHTLFVVEDGEAKVRKVELGARRAGEVQIIKGVTPDEEVVTAGHQKLQDGTPVVVR